MADLGVREEAFALTESNRIVRCRGGHYDGMAMGVSGTLSARGVERRARVGPRADRPTVRFAGPGRAVERVILICGLVALVGSSSLSCTSKHSYRAGIQSPDAVGRIVAIRQAGEQRDRLAVPLLVDRLEDEDEAVRFFAILALDRIVGQRMGFVYSQSDQQRAAAVSRWRQYLADGQQASSEQSGRRQAGQSGGVTSIGETGAGGSQDATEGGVQP